MTNNNRDRKSGNSIKSIENILPVIEKKLGEQDSSRTEFENLKSILPALKQSFNEEEERYLKLKEDIVKLDKRTSELYHKTEPSRINRIINSFKSIWRRSRYIFFIEVLLIIMLILTIVSPIIPIDSFHSYVLGIGFFIILVIYWFKEPFHRYLTLAIICSAPL